MPEFQRISIQQAADRAARTPIEEFEVSHWDLWQSDVVWPYFERMRAEDPVHYTAESRYGPYWSITRFDDIKAVDKNHQVFSSAKGISIVDGPEDFETTSFIASDPPVHDVQRKSVTPVVAPMIRYAWSMR